MSPVHPVSRHPCQPPLSSIGHHSFVHRQIYILTVKGFRDQTSVAASIMAYSARARRFAIGIVACLVPLGVIANDNSSFSEVEMLQAQLALLNGRPQDCPPWLVLFVFRLYM